MNSGRRAGRGSISAEVALDVVGDIYDAAFDVSLWPGVMTRIAGVVDANRAVLFTPGAHAREQFWAGHHLEPEMMAGYADYYHQKDLWTIRGIASGAHRGWNKTGEMIVPEEEFRQSEIWNDFMRHLEMYRLGTVIVDDGSTAPLPRTHLSVFGGHGRVAFDAHTLEFLTRIAPHVRRSLMIFRSFAEADAKTSALYAMLSATPTAMLTCTQDARVVVCNSAAESLLALHDGIHTAGGRLTCATSSATATLARMIVLAAGAGTRAGSGHGNSLPIARPSGARGFVAIVAPLPAEQRQPIGCQVPAVLVIIHRTDATLGAAADLLRSSYMLTSAELRLVAAMLDGQPLSAIAKRLGVTHSTARSQLKSVLAKTGTHRQSELLQLVLAFRHADR